MRKVVWFEIYVDDMARAQKFYETVLNTKLQDLSSPTENELVMKSFPDDPEKYGSGGSLVKAKGMEAGNNSTVAYFSCNDCAVEEARVNDAGGKVYQPKMSIGEYGFVALCNDTEGNMFGLHSME